jgi:hypothetical protein
MTRVPSRAAAVAAGSAAAAAVCTAAIALVHVAEADHFVELIGERGAANLALGAARICFRAEAVEAEAIDGRRRGRSSSTGKAEISGQYGTPPIAGAAPFAS